MKNSFQSGTIRLRAPVSESLTRLGRDPLQKFAQYLIAKLPEQILPIAQEILDDLLSEAQTGRRENVFFPLLLVSSATSTVAGLP